LRIGFDISQTGNNKAGCGYFADSLILGLINIDQENTYFLYPYFGSSFWDPEAKRSTRKIQKPNVYRKIIGTDFHDAMAFWENFPPDGEDRLGNPDIIHANNFSCPRGIAKARIIYTLHDLNFLEYPEFTTEQNRWVCFNGVFDAAICADFIISVSNYSRNRFIEVFPYYPKERIKTVHLGSRFNTGQAIKQKNTRLDKLVKDKFWLSVGTLEPRKNLRRLLKAFSIYRKEYRAPNYPLVLAGGKGWLEDDLKDFISSLELMGKVVVLGYVSDEDLSWLYRHCFAFIFPSIYEGFGLPVIEAMKMGAPVITTNSTSIPEVAGNAAHYVSPYNIEDFVKAFSMLADNDQYRRRLKDMSILQAKKFSWGKCATEVLEIYRNVIMIPKLREIQINNNNLISE
jgi:glycosyltransferase involved in cell wall biosynthesis